MGRKHRQAGWAVLGVALLALLYVAGCRSGPSAASQTPSPPQFLFDQQFNGNHGPLLVTIDRERYPPHYAGLWHTHPGPGSFCVLQGTLTIEVRSQPNVTLTSGQCWTEMPGVVHRPANLTDVEAVALFYLMAPAGQPRILPAPTPPSP